jgi:drug/metabolite transporter (DMT)-like permease
MKLKEWGAFALLGLVWGTSFLWIKIALEDITPFTLAAFRVLFGVIGLLVVMRVTGHSFPRDRVSLSKFAILSVFQTALPFALISWGETRIASGLASILNGTMPLFTIVIAHFFLHDEKMSLQRLAGLVVGFIGVVVLVSRDLVAEGLQGNVWGQLAVLAAAVSYAIGLTFNRKYLRGHQPVVQSAMTLIFADVLLWASVLLFERPFTLPTLPITWFALLWLGLLGSCLAYLLFFYLINAWGATRASVVTYVFPVVGLILGVLFLQEHVDWRLAVGSLLVVASIIVINVKLGRQLAPTPAPAAAEVKS